MKRKVEEREGGEVLNVEMIESQRESEFALFMAIGQQLKEPMKENVLAVEFLVEVKHSKNGVVCWLESYYDYTVLGAAINWKYNTDFQGWVTSQSAKDTFIGMQNVTKELNVDKLLKNLLLENGYEFRIQSNTVTGDSFFFGLFP